MITVVVTTACGTPDLCVKTFDAAFVENMLQTWTPCGCAGKVQFATHVYRLLLRVVIIVSATSASNHLFASGDCMLLYLKVGFK